MSGPSLRAWFTRQPPDQLEDLADVLSDEPQLLRHTPAAPGDAATTPTADKWAAAGAGGGAPAGDAALPVSSSSPLPALGDSPSKPARQPAGPEHGSAAAAAAAAERAAAGATASAGGWTALLPDVAAWLPTPGAGTGSHQPQHQQEQEQQEQQPQQQQQPASAPGWRDYLALPAAPTSAAAAAVHDGAAALGRLASTAHQACTSTAQQLGTAGGTAVGASVLGAAVGCVVAGPLGAAAGAKSGAAMVVAAAAGGVAVNHAVLARHQGEAGAPASEQELQELQPARPEGGADASSGAAAG